ncbi:MAG: hypothetical protein ACSLE1_01990 [Sphingobium sp.]
MDSVKLIGLMKMELRDGRTIRLCDGGFVTVSGETYTSADQFFGTIASLEAFSEGVGDTVPAFNMTFLPVSTAAAGDISASGMQGSRTRFYIVEVNAETDQPVEAADLQFDGQLDQTTLRIGRGKRELDVGVVSTSERLFSVNEGNSLNPRRHKSVFPGELGEDNATGLGISVAWGVETQPGAAVSYV